MPTHRRPPPRRTPPRRMSPRLQKSPSQTPLRRSPRRSLLPHLEGGDDGLSQPLLSPPAVREVQIDNRVPFDASQLSGEHDFEHDDESFGGGVARGGGGEGGEEEEEEEEEDKEDEEDQFAITDYTASQFDMNERVDHFMGRVPISSQNRVAVEAAYMVEAITLVRSMRSMRKSEIAEKAQDKYKSFIRGIPLSCFADASVKADMTERYFRSKSNSPEGFLTKANDVLKNVRAVAAGIRGIGTPLHQIPSGKSLTDMKNDFILNKYSAAQGLEYVPLNNDEELLRDIPVDWWMRYSTTNLLLAVLVHRCNPDIIADPTTIGPGQTRASMRDITRDNTAARRERDKIAENHGTERQRAEDSMMSSKAKLMAQTVDSGQIDQVKEQLNLFAQFKELHINVRDQGNGGQGQADFDQAAHDLLSELPFMKKRRHDGR